MQSEWNRNGHFTFNFHDSTAHVWQYYCKRLHLFSSFIVEFCLLKSTYRAIFCCNYTCKHIIGLFWSDISIKIEFRTDELKWYQINHFNNFTLLTIISIWSRYNSTNSSIIDKFFFFLAGKPLSFVKDSVQCQVRLRLHVHYNLLSCAVFCSVKFVFLPWHSFFWRIT